jgi:hypothetical protein
MEDEQAKKFFIAKIIAITIVAILVIFWFLNLNQVFKENATDSADNDLQEFKRQLDEIVTDTQKNFSQLNVASSTASSSLVSGVIENVEIDTAVSSSSGLDIEAAKKAVSSLASSSIIDLPENSESKKSPDCPAYVNCMPTIGEARPCIIPVGCEGITEKVY